MMAYRMASRSTKKETYTSKVPREFGCGIRRVITSARSSSQNNRRISAGEMLTIARCISPRPLRCVSSTHQIAGFRAIFASLTLSDKDDHEFHVFDEELFSIPIDVRDLRLSFIHILSIVLTDDSRRYHPSGEVPHSHRSSRRRR